MLHINYNDLTNVSDVNNFSTFTALLGSMSVWVSQFFGLAASPGVGVVRESVWVESATDELVIVSLIDGEWSVDGVLVLGSSGQQFWVDSWDSGDFWHFSSFASVTVPVIVSVVVQWVDSGTGPQVF